ncbi:MAG: BREX-2 system phosphatase PglZ [Sandaracinaceae bacterium]|nr:BREX-2 system phosphatase PglZ [Sandaracinaceae bacterium]
MLSRQDLEADLATLYEHDRQHHLFAYFGSGSEDMLDVKGAGRVFVVPVRSELDLRERLPRYTRGDERAVFLVPFVGQVPLDLQASFALDGRVRRIGSEARLRHLFRVAELDEDVRHSALASFLLARGDAAPMNAGASRLTVDRMWEAWLKQAWSIDWAGWLAVDTLLGWAAVNGQGGLCDADEHGETVPVREALLTYLDRKVPGVGRAIWRAWEQGKGAQLLELALVLEPLASAIEGAPDPGESATSMWLRMTVKAEVPLAENDDALRVGMVLGQAADGAMRHFENRTADVARVRALLNQADRRAAATEVPTAVRASGWLPIAWRAQLDNLGEALRQGAEALDAESVERVSTALRGLERHQLYKDADLTDVVKRATMAARLLAWLVARPEQRLTGRPTPYADAEALGRWYADEGGYVDWARRVARGPGADKLGVGVQAVVCAADAARLELDRRFAKGLQGWVEAGQPAHQVVPIHDALKRIAAPFLNTDDDHKLLVLLIDGMAWAQAVEMLTSLGEIPSAWGPLGWHQMKKHKLSDGFFPAVLAALPTETEVSRAAFFAGQPVKDGMRQPSSKDVVRFRDNKALAQFFEGSAAPELMLRAEGHTTGGAASEAALTLVGMSEARVVGIVINAIDNSLKGDSQQNQRWDVAAIRSLGHLLEKAREAGRNVLIASDHGHVPSDCFVGMSRVGEGGARWRVWSEATEPLADGEFGFAGASVWTPKGAHGVVLLGDDQHRYGGAPHAGEHGGATLAEVMTPCFLIGCAVDAEEGDAARAVMRAPVPRWWMFDVREVQVDPVEVEAAPVPKRKKPVPEAQLTLMGVVPEKPPEPVVPVGGHAGQPPSRAAALAESAEFQARAPKADRELTLRAVDFLLVRNGAATTEAFAQAVGSLSYRVGGVIAGLREVLNVDGYAVLRHDATGGQVYLDRDKLNELFEVSL